MTGVVLCGGQSSRMGTDKGLLQYRSDAWAQVTADKLASLQMPVVISVNEKQYPFYRRSFINLPLIEDNPHLSIGGPLKGILSVHLEIPQEDLLVLACDMPSMQIEVLEHLIRTQKENEADAYVFRLNERVEPLCGIYTAKGLKSLLQHYQQGKLKRYSLHHALEMINTFFIPLPPQWENYFTNYNTPADLKRLGQ